jgi:hypothetical protein
VDDKATDVIVRVPESPPRYLDVQVKTVPTDKATYLFLHKRHFTIEANRYLTSWCSTTATSQLSPWLRPHSGLNHRRPSPHPIARG